MAHSRTLASVRPQGRAAHGRRDPTTVTDLTVTRETAVRRGRIGAGHGVADRRGNPSRSGKTGRTALLASLPSLTRVTPHRRCSDVVSPPTWDAAFWYGLHLATHARRPSSNADIEG